MNALSLHIEPPRIVQAYVNNILCTHVMELIEFPI